MENNPKKSRALIITIIAIIVLIVVAYLLFKNSDKLFGTKNQSITKLFSPLLGTPKQKEVDTVNKDTKGAEDLIEENNIDKTLNTTGSNINEVVGGDVSGPINKKVGITAPFNPIPTPEEGISSGSSPIVGTTGGIKPIPTPEPTKNEDPKVCPIDEELEYTDAEKDELTELLRQYYLIAPELKTADEVAMINADIKRSQDLIDRADTLTLQCKEQKANIKYEGPRATKNNPYYGDLNVKPEFYAPKQFNDLEFELNIW